jgi:hypothetical protein
MFRVFIPGSCFMLTIEASNNNLCNIVFNQIALKSNNNRHLPDIY